MHATHVVCDATSADDARYVPAAQTEQMAAPSVELVLGAQASQLIAPLRGCCCCTAQSVHTVAPKEGMKLPRSHDRQCAEPLAGWKVPGLHAAQAVKPALTCAVPAAHGAQVLLPLKGCTLPGGQREHRIRPAAGLYVPGAHGEHESPMSSLPLGQPTVLRSVCVTAVEPHSARHTVWRACAFACV